MKRTSGVLVAGVLTALAGCADPELLGDDGDDGLDNGAFNLGTEEIRSVGSPPWVYAGPLPALLEPKVVVSLNGHTLRVVGELPSGFNGTVPYYATEERVNGKRMVTVVYPIATGASAGLDTPGRFYSVVATPFRPNGIARPSTGPTYVSWGGFPFMAYNGGVAFHGPITYTADGTEAGQRVYEWYLQRGPVSHGCNRMQGEHAVEVAHLLGVDMRNTWAANAKTTRRVFITVTRDYDRLPSGEAVDVDYPRTAGARAPTGAVRRFATWNADELPRLVCADMRATRTVGTRVGTDFCDRMPANTRDLATGTPTGPVVVDNIDGAFSATGAWATYNRSPSRVGSNYHALAAAMGGSVTWRLPVTTTGRFLLRARYAPDENRNTRVAYQVFTDGSAGSAQAALTVNQRLPGNQGWVDLGTFTLNAGARVVLTAAASSDGWTIADAVRLEPLR
ncbi:MAG: L,D-transpeptidase family protein [Deltaproteobacteria bacterium]|nr:L,D-transpeptidase family protein [Deltaproteobacteria bacterium]